MSVQNMNDAEFLSALQSNDRIIVKYYADWCGSCKLFAPKFRRMSNEESYQGITFVEINSEHNPQARLLANVDNLPYFATFLNGTLVEGGATAKEERVVAMLAGLNGTTG
jgi:thioredoxin 1